MFSHYWLPVWTILPAAIDAVRTRQVSKNKNKLRRSFPAARVVLLLRRVRYAAALHLVWITALTLVASTRALYRRVSWELGATSVGLNQTTHTQQKASESFYFGRRDRKSWWSSLRQTRSLYRQTMRVARRTDVTLLRVELPQRTCVWTEGIFCLHLIWNGSSLRRFFPPLLHQE